MNLGAWSLWALAMPSLIAPQVGQPEYELKARFLLQFPEFVAWPERTTTPDPSGPFVILVLGDSPFGDQLDRAAQGKKIRGRPVEVLYSRDPAALEGCEMVFICASERGRIPSLAARAQSLGVLTIGDSEGYGERGVMINLLIESDLPRFEINRTAADQAGFRLSSQLLGLARKVY